MRKLRIGPRYARCHLDTEHAMSVGWGKEMRRLQRQWKLPRAEWTAYFPTMGEQPLLEGMLRAQGKKGIAAVEAWADAIGRDRCSTGYTNGGAYYHVATVPLSQQPDDMPVEHWLSHDIQVCAYTGYVPVQWAAMLAMPAEEQLRAWTEKRHGWAFLSFDELTPAARDLYSTTVEPGP